MVSRSAAELAELHFGAEFAVFHGPDGDAPELTGFSIPSEVDTTGGAVDVPLTIAARDTVSGVENVVATIVPPDSEPPWIVIGGGFDDDSHLVSGSRYEGIWHRTHHLAPDARLGYYRVVSVRLRDIAGHERNYNAQDLRGLGYPTEFLDTGGPDTTPPEIVDFWFEPSTLRTSNGERTIQFYTWVRDDITGIADWSFGTPPATSVEIEPAFPWTEFSNSGKVPVLISGSHVDGVWQEELSLEEDALPGSYQASYVGATDRAGNKTVLLIPDLEARGFPHTFVNEP
jgi:hypothetical protein